MSARREAFRTLERRSGWLRRALLRRTHTLIELFAGTRDTPKHVNVLFNYAVRRAALAEGQQLVAAGRLDEPQHVFDLEFVDLAAAAAEPDLDLRNLRDQRTRFLPAAERRKSKTFRPLSIHAAGSCDRPHSQCGPANSWAWPFRPVWRPVPSKC